MGDEEKKSPDIPDASAGDRSLELHYEATLPEALALRDEELEVVNIDILAAVVTVKGCQSKLAPFIHEIETKLGSAVEMKYITGITRYAEAVAHSNREHLTASETSVPLVEWGEELGKTHELLFGDAEGFARHGLIDGSSLAGIKHHNGYRQLAGNVLNLVHLLRKNWSKIEHKTALTSAQVDAAQRDALRLVDAVGEKEQRIAAATQTSALRQRFFTLFYRMWEEWRRVMTFLRWAEEDQETYAPSLWLGRSARRKARDAKDGRPDGNTNSAADGKTADGKPGVVGAAGGVGGAGTPGGSAATNGTVASGTMTEQRFDR